VWQHKMAMRAADHMNAFLSSQHHINIADDHSQFAEEVTSISSVYNLTNFETDRLVDHFYNLIHVHSIEVFKLKWGSSDALSKEKYFREMLRIIKQKVRNTKSMKQSDSVQSLLRYLNTYVDQFRIMRQAIKREKRDMKVKDRKNKILVDMIQLIREAKKKQGSGEPRDLYRRLDRAYGKLFPSSKASNTGLRFKKAWATRDKK